MSNPSKTVKLRLVSDNRLASVTDNDAIDFGPLDQRLGHQLRRAQLAIFADFFEAFSEFGIKPAQYSCLTIIHCNPGLRQSQVAEALRIKKPNFVAMVQMLEARGLVRRASTQNDRRSNALYLTDKGNELIHELHRVAEVRENKIRSLVGEKSYLELFVPLKKIGQLVDPST